MSCLEYVQYIILIFFNRLNTIHINILQAVVTFKIKDYVKLYNNIWRGRATLILTYVEEL